MKTFQALVAVFCLAISVRGQEAFNTTINLPSSGEAVAEIKASSPGASWEKSGAEAASASLSLDGVYNQDVMLFLGSQSFNYRVFLGPVSAGKHQ